MGDVGLQIGEGGSGCGGGEDEVAVVFARGGCNPGVGQAGAFMSATPGLGWSSDERSRGLYYFLGGLLTLLATVACMFASAAVESAHLRAC